MSLKELSKEQKQYIVLGALAAVILAILLVLGIRFSMASVTDAKEELESLSEKISSADHALSRSKQTSIDYVQTVSVLREYMDRAPPARNYYSWATEVIYSKARLAGLEIDSIDEISIPQQSMPDDTDKISFESYSLRITAHGGYENTKYFLKQLEQDYPLVRFSGVEISSGQSPDSHDIQLFLQWPFNFGDISKIWDAVASKQNQVAALGTDSAASVSVQSEPVKAHASDMATQGDVQAPPARQPHPPTTRPTEDPEPVVNPVLSPITPEPQSQVKDPSVIEQPAADTPPAPATDAEILAILSESVPAAANPLNAESQRQLGEVEPIEEMPPAVESEPAAESGLVIEQEGVEPEPVEYSEPVEQPEPVKQPDSVTEVFEEPLSILEPESVVESQFQSELAEDKTAQKASAAEHATESSVEQEVLQPVSEPDELDNEPLPEVQDSETVDIVPDQDTSLSVESDNNGESTSDFVKPDVDQTSRQYVSTGKSEKILEELLSKGEATEGTSLSSFLDGLVGEINEK